jgi:hypothetical protein
MYDSYFQTCATLLICRRQGASVSVNLLFVLVVYGYEQSSICGGFYRIWQLRVRNRKWRHRKRPWPEVTEVIACACTDFPRFFYSYYSSSTKCWVRANVLICFKVYENFHSQQKNHKSCKQNYISIPLHDQVCFFLFAKQILCFTD